MDIVEQGPELEHTTGSIDIILPGATIVEVPDPQPCLDQPVLLHANTSLILSFNTPQMATDLSGRVLWYYHDTNSDTANFKTLTRPISGGNMLYQIRDFTGQYFLREIDLAGNILKETTKSRINEQLVTMGQDTITSIHHEAIRFPNGQTLILGDVERLMPGVQDPEIDDILGDMIIALNQNWQVIWTWNSFDHLDARRKALLEDTCSVDGLCADIELAEIANDWTHSNTIDYSPLDGNLILSIRHQSWVIKIDYQDGAGSGGIIWRLGHEGDFSIEPDDPSLWFSYQHDARYIGENQILLYDNGNERCTSEEGSYIEGCYSRGQVLNIDESAFQVSLAFNFDLGNYSAALGASQKLSNGNFHFTSGFQPVEISWEDGFGTSDEFLPDGSKTYSIETSSWVYRSYRLESLYTSP